MPAERQAERFRAGAAVRPANLLQGGRRVRKMCQDERIPRPV